MSLFSKDQEMVCPGCGNRIQSTDRFCKYCGRTMVQAAPAQPPSSNQRMQQCTGCGREIPEGLKFCPFCGKPTPVGTSVVAAPPIQPTPIQAQPAPMPQPAPAPAPTPVPVASAQVHPAATPSPAPQPSTKRCVGCGREINGSMKFCPFCGKADAAPTQAPPATPNGTRICPGCGKEISITHDFCPSCGYPKNPRFY